GEIVGIELFGRQPFAPGIIQRAAERIVEFAVKDGDGFPAGNVMIKRKARTGESPQFRLAQRLAVIDLFTVRGLEREANKLDELQQQTVAGFDGMVVDMP